MGRGLFRPIIGVALLIREDGAGFSLEFATFYYEPRPESAENLRLLRRLDERSRRARSSAASRSSGQSQANPAAYADCALLL